MYATLDTRRSQDLSSAECAILTTRTLHNGDVRIRHSSNDFGWQSSHSVDLAGWQAKMASIEIWIPWRNAHKPHSPLQSVTGIWNLCVKNINLYPVLLFFSLIVGSFFFFFFWTWRIEYWNNVWKVWKCQGNFAEAKLEEGEVSWSDRCKKSRIVRQ